MQVKTVAMILFGVVYLASVAAEATLLGTGGLTDSVGVPLLSSTVTLGLGAALALIEPGSGPGQPPQPSTSVTVPAMAAGAQAAPVAPSVPATPSAAPAGTTGAQEAPPAQVAAQEPAQITGQAAAPAMPGA